LEKVNDALEDAGIKAISKRQLYADIDFMKSRDGWEAPIPDFITLLRHQK
jgi:hypothetical protein